MADQTRTPRPAGITHVRENLEENVSQRDSDAPQDAVASGELQESSDRADGRGSDANGTTAFDETEGEERRKLYDKGATLVSKID